MSSRYFFTTPDSDKNRGFVAAYSEKFKELPDYMAGESYAGVSFLKEAIERAKSADADAVVQAVENEPLAWEAPEGWKVMRAEDHAAVEDSIQVEEICRTAEELRQVRGK